jgi:hypothetical protein
LSNGGSAGSTVAERLGTEFAPGLPYSKFRSTAEITMFGGICERRWREE